MQGGDAGLQVVGECCMYHSCVREPRAVMADSSAVLQVRVEAVLGQVCLAR